MGLSAGEAVAARVRAARRARRLSQRALGGRAGMNPAQVWEVETQGRDLELASVVRLARALRVPVWWLVGSAPARSVPPPCPVTTDEREAVAAFGRRLRVEREARGLSQRDVGRRTGGGQEQVARWEKARWSVRLSSVQRAADALGVPVAQLVDGDRWAA